MTKRAIILVMDSFGLGATPDAPRFGDEGADTLGHIAERRAEQGKPLLVPNLARLGLGLAAHLVHGRVLPGVSTDTITGIYGAARVGLVTPLRDGMNLVAKEYVAAQDPDDPGVLILSRFAGAARQLTEALLVNPHSPEDVADALKRALAMGLPERQRRWRALFDNVTREDVTAWRDNFVAALANDGALKPALVV